MTMHPEYYQHEIDALQSALTDTRARLQAVEAARNELTERQEGFAIACLALWDEPCPAAFALVEAYVSKTGVATVQEMREKRLPVLTTESAALRARLREMEGDMRARLRELDHQRFDAEPELKRWLSRFAALLDPAVTPTEQT